MTGLIKYTLIEEQSDRNDVYFEELDHEGTGG